MAALESTHPLVEHDGLCLEASSRHILPTPPSRTKTLALSAGYERNETRRVAVVCLGCIETDHTAGLLAF
eukprot:scaffold2353_cov167-Amphora_coffeaeformis.AAC.9